MNCKTLRQEIVPYYLQELPPAERAEFERHVQVCSHCARFSWRVSQTVFCIRAVYPLREPADLVGIVHRRIHRRPRWWISAIILAVIAGGAAYIIIHGVR